MQPTPAHPLPIDAILPELREALTKRHEVVLEAPPGAGKTTRTPLALLEEPWLGDQTILMLEPRRLAARAAAEQLARQLGEKPGETVGYRVRLDSCTSDLTRILVVTEGVLTRMLQSDPALEGVGLLIFDEFHERSLDADLGLALVLQGRELLREQPPLKLLVMSATLDGAAIADLLNDAPIVRSQGRSYPVKTIYTGNAAGEWIEPRVCKVIDQALSERSGSLLVFLPGQAEIRRVQTQLEPQLAGRDDLILAPLYGDLTLSRQQQAITPAPVGKRKIVLATAIAETSLTIEGIEVVIDAGLSRQAAFDPASGMTRLHTTRVSAASATQRAGRAGRLAPGYCYRLWSEGQQEQLTPYTPPEILQADLAPLALSLLNWGVDNPAELGWLDPPPKGAWQQALDLLRQLNACETLATGVTRLTAHGVKMARLPTHPRIAHMLVVAMRHGLTPPACDIAALLSERDPLREVGCDLSLRLDWMRNENSEARGRERTALRQRLRQLSSRFKQICCTGAPEADPVTDPWHPRWIGFLLAAAYPDRIARTRRNGGQHYRLSAGRGAELDSSDPLCRHPWLVVAELSGRQGDARDRIRLASPLEPELFERQLSALVTKQERVEWDEDQERLIAESQQRVGELVLNRKALTTPSPDARKQALLQLVRKKGLGLLPWNDTITLWRRRVAFCRTHGSCDNDSNREEWPDLSDRALLESLEQWLSPWLDEVSHINHFARLDLDAILKAQLPWPLRRQLDELAPERIRVPSGARLAIDYSESPPVLAVKLQEMFGCTATPGIGFGVQLKLHLLSPARRPLQVTQDLAGFWQNGYPEVKKEMKGRYPKHPWPDNPLEAPPTARTKKAGG